MMGKNPKYKYTTVEPKQKSPYSAGIQVGVLMFLALCLSLILVCTFGGCESGNKKQVPMTAEQKKAALNKQLDTKFENPQAHFELGQLYQAEGNWSKAEYHYNVALGFDPVNRPAQAALVKGLIDNGDKAKAEQYAKSYINQASNSVTASLQLAEAFNKQQLDNYTLACYQQALRLEPNSPEVNKQFGLYYLNKNNKERAKEYLSKSFQLNPNQPDVSGELGRLGVVVKIPEKKKK
jgi:tetratricopeptide (TPR) repeat protein